MDSLSPSGVPIEASPAKTAEPPGVERPEDKVSDVQKDNGSIQQQLRSVTDAALKFLSNASNETLGACAVGLCASTYLVLGRVGLVLIGAAGGVILHATWEGSSEDGKSAVPSTQKGNTKRKEIGIEVARRALDWRDRRNLEQEDGQGVLASPASSPGDYSDFRPATRSALAEFTDAAIRDYVRWWYSPILPSETTFLAVCKQELTGLIATFSSHLSKKRPADPVLDFLAHSTSIVVVFLGELSTALRAGQGQPAEDAIHQYLRQEPASSLANVLNKQQQRHKLHLVAEDVLAKFLNSKALDHAPSKVFLQEILAGVALETTIDKCSKPEWINGWIIHLLQDGEPEIMNVIDAGVGSVGGPLANTPKSPMQIDEQRRHARRVSKAEEAMQEAMIEAKRMNEMIAEEDARRKRDLGPNGENEDAASTATTEGVATPTSSDSDQNRVNERLSDSSTNLQQTADERSAQENIQPAARSFTDFGQLVQSQVPTALQPSSTSSSMAETIPPPVLTLHNAAITILDDGNASETPTFRSRPIAEYLLQIEPSVSRFPGWMIARQYQDLEKLHEVLRRISIISGVSQFADKHSILPSWRGQTKRSLRLNLEQYLRDALRYESLAESEAMKKFLEKETGLGKAPTSSRNVFLQGPAALETMGKGFVNVLGQAPKGIAGGGKAVLGGVQGVFGAVGGGKKAAPEMARSDTSTLFTSPHRPESVRSRNSQEDHQRGSSTVEATSPRFSRQSTEVYEPQRQSLSGSIQQLSSQESLHLPPRPSEIPEGYGPSWKGDPPTNLFMPPVTVDDSKTPLSSPTRAASVHSGSSKFPQDKKAKKIPITEEETRVSVELIFAIITELYSLSSAWTIRLSLLAAAKTFLLRPNNPQLESIRLLLQDSVIDSNFVSDEGLAAHILKLRANVLPTEEELKQWPPQMSEAEKEKTKVKARKLLVERGMPQALTSVMGNAASGEALGRFFDCLQVEEVARGLIFALLLQAMRAITQ